MSPFPDYFSSFQCFSYNSTSDLSRVFHDFFSQIYDLEVLTKTSVLIFLYVKKTRRKLPYLIVKGRYLIGINFK